MGLFDELENSGGHTATASGTYTSTQILHFTCQDQHGDADILDVWQPVRGLWLRPEDRAYISGAVNALQLSKAEHLALVTEYAKRWQAAARRCPHPNGTANAGRKAAPIAGYWAGCQGLLNGSTGQANNKSLPLSRMGGYIMG